MGFWQGISKRKSTGGRLRRAKGKRKREMGSEFIEPKIGDYKKKVMRTYGGHKKIKLKSSEFVNVNTQQGTKRAQIIKVVENPANIHYVRRNVLTKGAVVDTDVGRVRITSRPSQDGVLNAVLIE
ncbi:MAG: 30S ribosomal protein S8e [Candidatus Methanofastidiosia archaeon]